LDDLAVLFALLGVALFFAAPLVVVVLYWRQRKLNLRVDAIVANHSEQTDALHRELLELKRQLAAMQHAAEREEVHPAHTGAPEQRHEQVASPSVVEKSPTVERVVPIEKPVEPSRPVDKPVVAATPVTPEPVLPPAKKIEIPVAPPVAAAHSTAEVAPSTSREAEAKFCSWCGTVHAGGTDKCPTGATVAGRSTETIKPKPPVAEEEVVPRARACYC